MHDYLGTGEQKISDAKWLKEELDEGFEESDLLEIEERVRLAPGQGREFDSSGVGGLGAGWTGLGLCLESVCEWEPAFDALRMRLVTHFAIVNNPSAPAGVRSHWLR
jgi:hypothetical protein